MIPFTKKRKSAFAPTIPDDLTDAPPEAHLVWSAVASLKNDGNVDERWIAGWRLKAVARRGVRTDEKLDLYIRAPDMSPEKMARYVHGRAGDIRSFKQLSQKLRERKESGESERNADRTEWIAFEDTWAEIID